MKIDLTDIAKGNRQIFINELRPKMTTMIEEFILDTLEIEVTVKIKKLPIITKKQN